MKLLPSRINCVRPVPLLDGASLCLRASTPAGRRWYNYPLGTVTAVRHTIFNLTLLCQYMALWWS
eukprot:jgi/Phyca11/507282/fgenesh2_kg.PHYCAscaffold_26_\